MGGEKNQCRVLVEEREERGHLEHQSFDATRAYIKMNLKNRENSLCSG